ncbi:MAG: hypothetical protein HFG00_10590 [Oscillibacter sp.]|nr:hypothetical protein [Oscillibacter sp.]
MTIRDREEALFARWKSQRMYASFVEDGVFDEAMWNRQSLHITFVLKDPHWPGGTGKLRDSLLVHDPHPNHWRTWNNIARWTQALLDGGTYQERFSLEERRAQLRRVSCLNLKKVGGGPRVSDRIVRDFARKDWSYIRDQLLLYTPDILVCCGPVVGRALSRDVFPRAGLPVRDWEEEDGWTCFYTRFPEKQRLTPVVCFRHPQGRACRAVWRTWFRQMREARALLLPSP